MSEAGGRSDRIGPTDVRGATVLRARRPSPWRNVGLISALATAAVIALVVYGVLPRLGAPTTLSASEVLERSLQTISSGQGVERVMQPFAPRYTGTGFYSTDHPKGALRATSA